MLSELNGSLLTANGNRPNQTNTFYIDGSRDPKAVADEVSTILQKQVDRRNAVWA
jgi:hypothetical protein